MNRVIDTQTIRALLPREISANPDEASFAEDSIMAVLAACAKVISQNWQQLTAETDTALAYALAIKHAEFDCRELISVEAGLTISIRHKHVAQINESRGDQQVMDFGADIHVLPEPEPAAPAPEEIALPPKPKPKRKQKDTDN